MVQEFHVLRCFSCETFQVQQVKKVNKWSCKVCGQKQSVIKEFGRGSGADCRRHVQKLNTARGAKMEEDTAPRAKMEIQMLWKPTEFYEEEQLQHNLVSRWDKYLPAPQEEAGHTPKGVGPEGEAEPEEEAESEETVVMDRDRLNFRKHSFGFRPKRLEPYDHHQKKRRTSDQQDVSRPHSSSRVLSSPSVPRAPSIPSIPSVIPSRVVSKWSAFLENPSVSKPCAGFSGSSLFQSDEDLDLDLDWI